MKNPVTPYLFFNGNCREAMTWYQGVFGGSLEVMTYEQAGPDACPMELKDHVMHAALKNGQMTLMASDSGLGEVKQGTTLHLALDCDSVDELETLYRQLTEGREGEHPPQDMFWGARFGVAKDRYGFEWMLSFDKNKKGGTK